MNYLIVMLVGGAMEFTGMYWGFFDIGDLLIYTLLWITSIIAASMADLETVKAKDMNEILEWIREQKKCTPETDSSRTLRPPV
jgi:hypothetical protein